MKTSKLRLSVLVAGVMLFISPRSQAYYTNFLDAASNSLTTAYNSLTSNPTPTRLEKRQAVAISRALMDLSKPSTSVAGDYNLLLAAATHLGPIALSPEFAPVGSNVFNLFTNEAQAEIVQTAARVSALSDFVRVKKAASNQVAKAQAALDSIDALDPRVSLLVGRLVFARINTANRLAAIGEAHPGFAPDSVIGKTLTHTEGGRTGMLHFDDATSATNTDDQGTPETQNYTWTRTKLNSALLVLTHGCDGGGTSTTTVKLSFTSATAGTFVARDEDCDGGVHSQSGRFTID